VLKNICARSLKRIPTYRGNLVSNVPGWKFRTNQMEYLRHTAIHLQPLIEVAAN
jgi:hypothetical protein